VCLIEAADGCHEAAPNQPLRGLTGVDRVVPTVVRVRRLGQGFRFRDNPSAASTWSTCSGSLARRWPETHWDSRASLRIPVKTSETGRPIANAGVTKRGRRWASARHLSPRLAASGSVGMSGWHSRWTHSRRSPAPPRTTHPYLHPKPSCALVTGYRHLPLSFTGPT